MIWSEDVKLDGWGGFAGIDMGYWEVIWDGGWDNWDGHM